MLFNSLDFAVFLPVVFILYWLFSNQNIRFQNLFLIFASYIFYAWWDWRFLSLIIFSTLVDYTVGLKLKQETNKRKRKIYLLLSIFVNLGFLGFFKYYNFFLENFVTAFSFFGNEIQGQSLNIILPVGISFYTFQTMSYTIDVYKKKFQPTSDLIAFAAFVSFFPQLVAGPIERAKRLLPQFYRKREFDYTRAVDGLRQILWGLFKKVVIADNCAELANYIFNNSSEMNASALLLGAFFFAFQIYGDFSGYSDIAIGTARLFDIKLMQNFAHPYFSRDVAEFWRRWHISLSTWFRDYVYIPLGGSKGNTFMQVRNIFIIFIVSGFWHGANWTFIIWGLLNALYFLPLLLTGRNRENLNVVAEGKILPSIREFSSLILTFGLISFSWIFFRAESVTHSLNYIEGLFSLSLFSLPSVPGIKKVLLIGTLIILFLIIEWQGREKEYAMKDIAQNWPRPVRYILYYTFTGLVLWFSGNQQEFIYFQF